MHGMKTITAILATTSAMTGALLTAQPAMAESKTTKTVTNQIAYVRGGDIYVGTGSTEKRLTTGGGHARPRWSPDGRRIAYLTGAQLWTMNADGTAPKRLTIRAAAGPSWSPDGKWIAFASLSCNGGPGVYRIPATGGAPEVLFPSDCRGEELPPEPAAVAPRAGSLTDRLRTDDAVAWSPDGKKIAFRGGECESVYDSCLSIGAVASGGEQTVAAYGGGSLENQGFAVVPSWRSDGARLAWTAYQVGETTADNRPVHLVEYNPAGGTRRTVGGALDRELAYLDATHAVVTAQYQGGSWVMLVGLADGARQPFHQGSQPSVRPTR
jgi:TolB protein